MAGIEEIVRKLRGVFFALSNVFYFAFKVLPYLRILTRWQMMNTTR